MCVDAFAEILWDAGSIPAASTIYNYLNYTKIEQFYFSILVVAARPGGVSYHPMDACNFHVGNSTEKDAVT